MLYENRSYIIFPVTELNKIDFTKIQETDVNSLRFSVDKTKTFIKWEGDPPIFINSLENKSEIYSHEQIKNLLSSSEWTSTTFPFIEGD